MSEHGSGEGENDTPTRYFVIEGPPKTIESYLPRNFKLTGIEEDGDTTYCYIEGSNFAGWTVDEYLKPRLESGLWFGLTELPLDPFKAGVSHPNIQPWPVSE